MPLFRRSDSSNERTPEEREYARRVREARRKGLPDPPRPEALDEPPAPEMPGAEALEPEAVPSEPRAAEPEPEPAWTEEPAESAPEATPPADETPFEPEPPPEAAPPAGEIPRDEAATAAAEPAPEATPPAADEAPFEAEPAPEATPPAGEPAGGEAAPPAPEPEPDIAWTEPTREHAARPDEPAPPADATPDLPPTEAHDVPGIWEDEHPQPGPGRLGGVERQPPPLPARHSARPLPKPPRRRYAGAPPRTPAGPPAKRRRSWAGRIFALATIVVAVVVLWFLFSLFQPGKGEGEGRVAVTIPNGATSREIGDLLAEEGVVSSGFFFDLRARINGKRDDLKAGKFVLANDMSYGAAFERLSAVPEAEPTVRVTMPEGRSIREAAAAVKEAGVEGNYVQAANRHKGFHPREYDAPKGVDTLEGFLFPATYELPASKANAKRLVGDQLEAFEQNFGEVNLRAAKRANLTPYDVLIIASMVEREAQVPKERRQIAAVIYNRLKDGMALGIDATTRYELDEWSRPLRVSELEADTPYNTRTNTGLPPTPIGSPGLASIEAAANPADVDYLFYVVKPGTCGEHDFSSDDAEFQRDVAAYEAARAANGGKAPTTCP